LRLRAIFRYSKQFIERACPPGRLSIQRSKTTNDGEGGMADLDARDAAPPVPDGPSASTPAEATATAPSEPTPPAPGERPPEPRRCRLRFTGTGREYFGIWIVNLLLTIVTLGIYSAWAKVRKLQYFYRNTQLDGSAFEYHGNPVAILKGRLLAVALLVVYKVALATLGAFALIPMLAVMAAVPWLLAQSYRFRLRNSGYRGLRFRFAGAVSEAYFFVGLPMILLLAPGALIQSGVVAGDPKHPSGMLAIAIVIAYLVLAAIWPYLHFSFKRWQHGHSFYGTGRGRFEARAREFYGAYGAAAAILFFVTIPAFLLIGVISALSDTPGPSAARTGMVVGIVFAALFYVAALLVGSLVTAGIQNATWSGTRLASVAFSGDMRAGRLAGIMLGNILMVIVSLGLLIPVAVMRLMKYKIESIEVLDADALARFVGDEIGTQVGTLGEGAIDVMDFDFGL
jgi:uncharacterized membrane protein YjgN (DUF898 family)